MGQAAQAQGMEIGNHTMNHLDLSKLDADLQAAEIEAAEDAFIAHGLDCHSLCYPFGKFNEATRDAVDREGYKVGVALGHRPARPGDDLRFLPRIVVSYSDRLPKLLYRIYLRPKLPTFRRRSHYVS
jgi:peptidoglycan/xylan/chitin deacetylase (PgdA/CDA1 family)